MRLRDISLSTRITFWVLLFVVAGGLLWINNEDSRLHDIYLTEHSADLDDALHVEQVRLNQAIETLRQDVLFLSNTPPISGIVRASANNGTDPRDNDSYTKWEARAQEIFAAFLRAHPDYFQVMYIGAAGDGRELVRVENNNGRVEVAPLDALQAKGDRDYFKAGLMLTAGRIHLSEFSLNRESGKIVELSRPTMRAVTTVFDANGHVFGMVVLGKDVRWLFASATAGLPSGVESYISDQYGHYLLHPDAKRAFAAELGSKENIADDFPALKPLLEVQTKQDGLPFQAVNNGMGGYLVAKRAFFDASDPSRFLLLAYHIPAVGGVHRVSNIGVPNLIYTLLAMFLVSGLFMLILRHTFFPLKRIIAAAGVIAAGAREVRLAESGKGEIGELAKALNTMLDKLSEGKLIEQENTFRKELIESLPGVFYMIDAQGRFLMWNHNLEQVSQCSAEELAASHPLDFFEGESKVDIANAIRKVFEEGEVSLEAEMLVKDGSRSPYHFTGRRVMRDGEPVLIGLGLDITEQRESVRETKALLRRNQTLMQNSMEGIHVLDMDGNMLDVNESFCRMLGYTREEAMRLNVTDWDKQVLPDGLHERLTDYIGKSDMFETVHQRKDGSLLDVEICATGVQIDGTGFLFASSRDITLRNKTMAMLHMHKQVIDTAMDGFWMADTHGFLREVNEAYARMSGYTMQELVGMHISELEAIEREEDVKARIDKIMAVGYDRFETRHRRKDGRIIDLEIAITFMQESGNFFVFCHNITQRKQAGEALRVAAAAFETHEAILITDAQANIVRVNGAFTGITGYSAEEVIGKNPRIMSSGRHDNAFYAAMWRQILETDSWAGEIWDRRKSGEIFPKWMSITAVKNDLGETTQYVGIFSDITERKRAEDEIRNLAFYDALTQLPNRRLFLERFQSALAVSARYNDHGAILFIDMDNFKSLNDSYGHDIGDLLLIEVATRIRSCVREIDTVGRFGGDEFVVLLESISGEIKEASHKAGVVAEKIREELSQPYQLKDHKHSSSPSIGISLYHGNDETMEVLLKHADEAMYQAKQAGRNKVRFYSSNVHDYEI